jgi:division protein CdvB (Snf7/Vps24/ESCRT-III family)
VEDGTEDAEDIWAELDDLNDDLDGVMDSVGLLLMEDEQSFWPDD